MAGVAADRMATAAFGNQIELAEKRVQVVVEGLVVKYVPYSVRAVVAEFPSYFEKVKFASVTTSKTYADGYVGHEDYIGSPISFSIPKGCQHLDHVSPTEYKELKKLYMRVKTIKKEKNNFLQQILDALIALKTENKVRECLPEALPYIDFPEKVQLPAPIFGTLRNILKNIKTDDNEKEKK